MWLFLGSGEELSCSGKGMMILKQVLKNCVCVCVCVHVRTRIHARSVVSDSIPWTVVYQALCPCGFPR